jgi:hypothetical protein
LRASSICSKVMLSKAADSSLKKRCPCFPVRLASLVKTLSSKNESCVKVPGKTDVSAPTNSLWSMILSSILVNTSFKKVFCTVSSRVIGQSGLMLLLNGLLPYRIKIMFAFNQIVEAG